MAPKFLTRSFGIAAVSLLMFLGGATPAAASDLDLGQPATMDDLLASPEYRTEHADVLRLYLAFLDRQPDVAGAAYWIYENENGVSEDDLAWGFSQSEEFTDRYGSGLDNAQFLSIVYTNVLGRSPDAEGFDYWLGEMNNGLAKHEVVRWIVANDEFIRRAPFTRTSPDLTAALVSYDDVDPTLQGYYIDGPIYASFDDPPPVACEHPLMLPDNARGTAFMEDAPVAEITKTVIGNDVYGFSDPTRAAAMVAEIKRSFTGECASYIDAWGATNTRSNVTVPASCSTCVMWEMSNLSLNFGGRVWHSRGMAIQVGYAISILEVSNWTRPSEAELMIQADRVRSRLEALISN